MRIHIETTSNAFRTHALRRRNLKTQQSLVILDLCLRKSQSGKSNNYRNAIVFKKLRFQNVYRPHEKPAFSNSSDLKSAFQKLRFQIQSLIWYSYPPILSSFELSPVSCSSNTTLVSYNSSFCSFNSCKHQVDLCNHFN